MGNKNLVAIISLLTVTASAATLAERPQRVDIDAAVAELGLMEDQEQAVIGVMESYRDKFRSLRQGEGERGDKRKVMRGLRTDMREELAALMSEEQVEQLLASIRPKRRDRTFQPEN